MKKSQQMNTLVSYDYSSGFDVQSESATEQEGEGSPEAVLMYEREAAEALALAEYYRSHRFLERWSNDSEGHLIDHFRESQR